jgi:hypothetical protein
VHGTVCRYPQQPVEKQCNETDTNATDCNATKSGGTFVLPAVSLEAVVDARVLDPTSEVRKDYLSKATKQLAASIGVPVEDIQKVVIREARRRRLLAGKTVKLDFIVNSIDTAILSSVHTKLRSALADPDSELVTSLTTEPGSVTSTFFHSCPSNKVLDIAGFCIFCAAGMYKTDGGDTPTKASARDADALCNSCKLGQYSDPAAGKLACVSCTAGSYDKDSEPATPCEPCPLGQYSAAEDWPRKGDTQCISCVTGKWADEGSSDCNLCRQGYFAELTQDRTAVIQMQRLSLQRRAKALGIAESKLAIILQKDNVLEPLREAVVALYTDPNMPCRSCRDILVNPQADTSFGGTPALTDPRTCPGGSYINRSTSGKFTEGSGAALSPLLGFWVHILEDGAIELLPCETKEACLEAAIHPVTKCAYQLDPDVSIHKMKHSEECPSSCTGGGFKTASGICECEGCAANHPDEYPTVTDATPNVPFAFCGARFKGFLCAECIAGHVKVSGECQPCDGFDWAGLASTAGVMLGTALFLRPGPLGAFKRPQCFP